MGSADADAETDSEDEAGSAADGDSEAAWSELAWADAEAAWSELTDSGSVAASVEDASALTEDAASETAAESTLSEAVDELVAGADEQPTTRSAANQQINRMDVTANDDLFIMVHSFSRLRPYNTTIASRNRSLRIWVTA